MTGVFRRDGKKNLHNNAVYIFTVFLFMIIPLFATTGCNKNTQRELPSFATASASDPQNTIAGASVPAMQGATPLPRLKVASPISQETMDQLVLLYSEKMSVAAMGAGNEDDDSSNPTTVVPILEVLVVETPDDGANDLMIWDWIQTDAMPDIAYVSQLEDLNDNGAILPLDSYLADDPLFSPVEIFSKSLDVCRSNFQLYGIPFRGSAEVLYMDREILEAAEIYDVPYILDMEGFLSISQVLADVYPPEQGQAATVPFYDAAELLPFLPNANSPDSGWFTYRDDMFHFGDESFQESASLLRSYVDAGFSYKALYRGFPEDVSEEDPRLSGSVAMWSGETKEWELYSKNGERDLFMTKIPSSSGSRQPTAVTVYPLCVSANTSHPGTAASFAAFLALDPDAVSLQKDSIESLLFPFIASEDVWQTMYEEGAGAGMWKTHLEEMPHSYYSPSTSQRQVYEQMNALIFQAGETILNPTVDFNAGMEVFMSAENGEG